MGIVLLALQHRMINKKRLKLKAFVRITGHTARYDLNINELFTISSEISDYTKIKHV